jgi:cytochrome c5
MYLSLALSLAFALSLASVRAQGDERSGRDVVDEVCAACHETGAEGAPKIGDRQSWSKRASQGLSSLTRHALEGIRRMPAHGGRSDLSDLEIARAVTYMVNRSGGNWVEPASAEDLSTERSGEQVVSAQCVKCHAEGVGGAPKIGDRDAWVQRMKRGLVVLVHSAIHGHGGMPPRGGEASLTDAEVRTAILYMFNPAGAAAKTSSVAVQPDVDADMDPFHRSVGGIEIHLGLIPAQMLYALPQESPERTMHGGIPEDPGYYHVNVSLYDAKSGAPIDDAQVRIQLKEPGFNSTTTKLERMEFGGGNYGTYTKPQPGTLYLLTVYIERLGTAQIVEAKFNYTFE